jgi:hypothetical protein
MVFSNFEIVLKTPVGLLISVSQFQCGDPNKITMISIADLQENDVVCGRTTVTHTYVGNKLFRSLIQEHAFIYQSTPNRSVKKKTTLDVIDMIRAVDGRFLKVADKSSKNTPETFEVASFDFI